MGRVGDAVAGRSTCAPRARRFRPQLVHAHNAVPAGEAVRRAGARRYVVSVHGGDVFHTAPRHAPGERAVRETLGAARLVLANSSGHRAALRAARRTSHPTSCTSGPTFPSRSPRDPHTLVTVAHLIARKRHADVLRAMWLLRERDARPALS